MLKFELTPAGTFIGRSYVLGEAKLTKKNRRSVGNAVLHSRFRLTPAEARIALGIARGEALRAIAETHGIAVATARTQLKSVFKKTGTHRQAELTALLAVGLAPH
jgi:DNA-binding CsgD family transcriptional regulator